MADVHEDLTRRVADLARLELTDPEIRTFTLQLRDILNYVEQLSQVETRGVDPLTHPLDLETPLRTDVARPFPVDQHHRPRVLQAAPDTENDGYKVPPIL